MCQTKTTLEQIYKNALPERYRNIAQNILPDFMMRKSKNWPGLSGAHLRGEHLYVY